MLKKILVTLLVLVSLIVPVLSQTILKAYLISKGLMPRETYLVTAVIMVAYLIGLASAWILCKKSR